MLPRPEWIDESERMAIVEEPMIYITNFRPSGDITILVDDQAWTGQARALSMEAMIGEPAKVEMAFYPRMVRPRDGEDPPFLASERAQIERALTLFDEVQARMVEMIETGPQLIQGMDEIRGILNDVVSGEAARRQLGRPPVAQLKPPIVFRSNPEVERAYRRMRAVGLMANDLMDNKRAPIIQGVNDALEAIEALARAMANERAEKPSAIQVKFDVEPDVVERLKAPMGTAQNRNSSQASQDDDPFPAPEPRGVRVLANGLANIMAMGKTKYGDLATYNRQEIYKSLAQIEKALGMCRNSEWNAGFIRARVAAYQKLEDEYAGTIKPNKAAMIRTKQDLYVGEILGCIRTWPDPTPDQNRILTAASLAADLTRRLVKDDTKVNPANANYAMIQWLDEIIQADPQSDREEEIRSMAITAKMLFQKSMDKKGEEEERVYWWAWFVNAMRKVGTRVGVDVPAIEEEEPTPEPTPEPAPEPTTPELPAVAADPLIGKAPRERRARRSL